MTLSEDALRLWETAQALALQAANVSPVHGQSQSKARLPPLLYFTDPQRSPDPVATAARLPRGSGVVYRHFGADNAFEIAKALRKVTLESGVVLLIGRDADLAEKVEADGVHLPSVNMGQAQILRLTYPEWLITAAAHDLMEVEKASAALNALVVSPVFPAGGFSSAKPDLGLDAFRQLVSAAPCPVYGLGGIGAGNAESLLGTGACGLAGVEAIQAVFCR